MSQENDLPNPLRTDIPEEEIERMEQLGDDIHPFYYRYHQVFQRAIDDPQLMTQLETMKEIGAHTRALRKSLGLTRETVAKKIGVSYVELVAFEGGLIPKKDLPKGFAQKLSIILTQELESTK